MGLDIVELFMAVEARFGVDIPDEEAEQMRTVGSLHQWLVNQRPARFPTQRTRLITPDPEPLPDSEFTPHEIWLILLDIIEEQAGVERSIIQPETFWVEDLGLD